MSSPYEQTLFSSLQSFGIEEGRSLPYWLGVYLRKTGPPIGPHLRTILETLRRTVPKEQLGEVLLFSDIPQVASLAGCRPSQMEEFIDFRNDLFSLCQESVPDDGEGGGSPFPACIQDIRPILEDMVSEIPPKVAGAVTKFLEDAQGDISEFYAKIYDPSAYLDGVKYMRDPFREELVPYLESLRDFIGSMRTEEAVRAKVSERLECRKADGDLGKLTGRDFPQGISQLLPVISQMIDTLPTRAANCMRAILGDCLFSVPFFYIFLLHPDDKLDNLPGLGKKTRSQMVPFISRMREFLDSVRTEDDVLAQLGTLQPAASSNETDAWSLSDTAGGEAASLGEKLGHVPVFRLIRNFIEGQAGSLGVVFREGLPIYASRTPLSGKDLSVRLSLSLEWIRQLRKGAFDTLEEYVLSLRSSYSDVDYSFPLPSAELEERVNGSEGTDFNANLILWVLSLLSGGSVVTVVCDLGPGRVGSLRGYAHPLAVDGRTAAQFDFGGFLSRLQEMQGERRTKDVSVPLEEMMSPFVLGGDRSSVVERASRYLAPFLAEEYPLLFRQDGMLVFLANHSKTITQIAEEILERTAKPMTAGQVVGQFRECYPHVKAKESSIKSALTKSGLIIAIGRSGTYVHARYKDQVGITEGERAFVRHMLETSPSKVLPLDDIIAEVTSVNPTREGSRIHNNLMSRTGSGDFQLFYRSGVRYIGLFDGECPPGFLPSYGTARNDSILFPQLEEYLRHEGHFPFGDNAVLSRFWSSKSEAYGNGTMHQACLKWYERILSSYGHYAATRSDFLWLVHYALIARETGMDLGRDSYLGNLSVQDMAVDKETWLRDNIDQYLDSPEGMPAPLRVRFETLMWHLSRVDSSYAMLVALSGIHETNFIFNT